MDDQLTPGMQQRIRILQRYMGAMENGDVDALVTVLTEIEQDQTLERMLREVSEVYEEEDLTQATPADAALVRQLLLNAMPARPRTEEVPVSVNSSSVDIPSGPTLDTTTEREELLNTPQAQMLKTARKAPTQVLPARKAEPQKWYRARRTWLVAAVVAVLIALVFFPNSGVFANQLFSFFHVQQFQPVQITKQDIQDLSSRPIPSLEDLGSLEAQPGSLKTHDHLTEAQATQMVSFPILLPHSLPQGIPNNPDFSVIDGGHATFTFHTSQAHTYFVNHGYGNVSIPANLDGATFDLTTTAGVLIVYGTQAETQFMVAEIPSPVINATGKASLQELRDFVLSLPGLPPQIVAQLRQIDLNSGVVPLPIPSGVDSQAITVHGTTGLLLTNKVSTTIAQIKQFPAGSAAVWQEQGIIYALGGTVSDTNQLLAAANSLR